MSREQEIQDRQRINYEEPNYLRRLKHRKQKNYKKLTEQRENHRDEIAETIYTNQLALCNVWRYNHSTIRNAYR